MLLYVKRMESAGKRITKDTAAVPSVSVVMPAHNALPHLDGAIESILAQTFSDFEFVILDDASTDGSGDRLKYWVNRDSRIRLLAAERHLGPVGSSNMVANAARAAIVARMDADDLSSPERLAEQWAVLSDNPDVGVVGSLCFMIDESGAVLRQPEAWRIAHRSPFVPFAHGSMMYRRRLFEEVGGYREGCVYWEDQDLVVRMAEQSAVLVLPRPLYQYRAWTRSTRLISNDEEMEDALDRMYVVTDGLRSQRAYPPTNRSRSSARINPRVFIALGSIHLWAGDRPQLFRRLIRRGDLSLSCSTAFSLIWTGWASLSPTSLQRFLRLLLSVRNAFSARVLEEGMPVQWDPFERHAVGSSERHSPRT